MQSTNQQTNAIKNKPKQNAIVKNPTNNCNHHQQTNLQQMLLTICRREEGF
jgi:hypothetical protein